MKVSVHLRGGPNLTNFRSEVLAEGLEALGHTVVVRSRAEGCGDADLMVQTAFSRSYAVMDAIGKRIPFLIMEAPFWRHIPMEDWVSWGYNGLAGGAFRHSAPDKERPKPELQPWKEDGAIIVFGQKPTDHSLRGHSHADWIVSKLEEYPDAEFRPHPLTVPRESLEPFAQAISRCKKAITFSSTSGAEALIAGCESQPEHPGSIAYEVSDREQWLHETSWAQFRRHEFCEGGAEHIIGGYDEARARSEQGLVEEPRLRVDGQKEFARYNATLESWRHRERGVCEH